MTAQLSLADELEELLAEGTAGAKAREQTQFDAFIEPFHNAIVLFGAGQMGRRVLAVLRARGIEPLAFADNGRDKWGTSVDGLTVLEPAEAARLYGADAAFIVTIWGAFSRDRMRDRVGQLRAMGVRTVETFEPLFWRHADALMPHYGLDSPHKVHQAAQAVRRAFTLWSDDASRREYLNQLRWRLYGDFDALGAPVDHPIYFAPDLFALADDEVFVDCGAYDGDTIGLFARQARGRFRSAVAFEPDPANFARLERSVGALEPSIAARVELRRCATGARTERLRFVADGSLGSHAATGASDAAIEVDCVALDDALGTPPTFVKMDIEGAEMDALAGARTILRDHAPILAVSAYHTQDHLWTIPGLIDDLHPGYDFYLRPHDIEMWDLVCYAVPARRALVAGGSRTSERASR